MLEFVPGGPSGDGEALGHSHGLTVDRPNPNIATMVMLKVLVIKNQTIFCLIKLQLMIHLLWIKFLTIMIPGRQNGEQELVKLVDF